MLDEFLRKKQYKLPVENYSNDDRSQLEKELNEISLIISGNCFHCTNLSGVNGILHDLHPSFKGCLKKSH